MTQNHWNGRKIINYDELNIKEKKRAEEKK